jgi:hypothetical protein
LIICLLVRSNNYKARGWGSEAFCDFRQLLHNFRQRPILGCLDGFLVKKSNFLWLFYSLPSAYLCFMIKIPYGISNFETLVKRGDYFVDRTNYLQHLESLAESYLFFLRPRRFGKSLWLSVMQYYYGIEHKEKFQTLFGKYEIGANPTSLANRFLILKFDFSGIDTTTKEHTYIGFSTKVREGIQQFLGVYHHYFSAEIREDILSKSAPEIMIGSLFTYAYSADIPKIYILIDEYDHFTNELISHRLSEFKEITGAEGYVRSFYERIKSATQEGVVDRFFATGVSPVTLDSLTSGFNIGSTISKAASFNEMLGFSEDEVKEILKGIGIDDIELGGMLDEIRKWYNGYLFEADGLERMYNSDMVLYFAKEYQRQNRYPKSLLDTNISSDYGKIGKLFRIGGEEKSRWETLEKLIREETVSVQLTEQFSFARKFTEYDFLSLLFYMGLLTIDEADLSNVKLKIPNEVIKELYFQYFLEQIQVQMNLDIRPSHVVDSVLELAKHNNPQPLINLMEDTLRQLSNRDWPGFDEKHLKTILVAYFYTVGIYHIQSEPELEQKYADLLLRRRPPYEPPYQFMIELKFLHKKDADKAEVVADEGRTQLKTYLQADEVQGLDNLKAWLWVFVGTESVLVEEVKQA